MQLQVVGPNDGKLVQIRGFGTRFMVEPEQGGGFALIEHTIRRRSHVTSRSSSR